MKKPSIEAIEVNIKILNDSLSKFELRQKELRDLDATVYQESSINDYVSDVNLIIDELKYLTRSNLFFARNSTFIERQNLVSWLSNLVVFLDRDDFSNIEQTLHTIKPNLRSYYVFLKKEFSWELKQEIQDLESLKFKIQLSLQETQETQKKLIDQHKEFSSKYYALEQLETVFVDRLTNTEERLKSLNITIDSTKEKEQEIIELLNSAKSNEWVIDNFAKRVENRESQLDKQEQKTIDYQTKLTSFETERTNKLTEAQSLIDSAKEAMKYKTAEWISAAIQEQYDEAKSKWNTIPWLISAVIFLIITIVLGVMIVSWWKWGLTNATDHWSLIVWRIALLPVLIAGLIFSAGRYTKQKHIIEDYAYKMVLAKSIIGFSEQLLKVKETNDGYQEFIKQTLSQLLQDPLRDRKEKQDEMVIIDKAKDIVSWVADIAGKFMPWK